MNAADRVIRWSTALAVLGVAAVAAVVSCERASALVHAHGESGWTGRLIPLTVDGLIYASSMVMLDSARRGARVPALARWLLGVGIDCPVGVVRLVRVLHLAPLYQPVRDDMEYGGIERLVLLLDKALSADGHDVVTIAREGSQVAGELVAVGGASGYEEQVRVALEPATRSAFDVIQVHRREFFDLDGAAAVKRDLPGVKVVATLHGALRPSTPCSGPSLVSSSTRWPARTWASQPPTPVKRRKPSSSMCVTISPISSIWPTIASDGAPGVVPGTRTTAEPTTSIETSSLKARPACANTAAGADS